MREGRRGMPPANQERREKGPKVELELYEQVEMPGETVESLRAKLEEVMSNPDNLLGVGGIGEVFSIGDRFCVKMMKVTPDRTIGGTRNPVAREVEIQSVLEDLEVDGVRVPKCFGYWEAALDDGLRAGIIMEQLDAVNLQLVLNGVEAAPEAFDPETFHEDLQAFLEEMHERNILHNDLFPRNTMIDRNTGKPRLIDFGNSRNIVALPERQRELLKHKELITQLEERFEKDLQAYQDKQG